MTIDEKKFVRIFRWYNDVLMLRGDRIRALQDLRDKLVELLLTRLSYVTDLSRRLPDNATDNELWLRRNTENNYKDFKIHLLSFNEKHGNMFPFITRLVNDEPEAIAEANMVLMACLPPTPIDTFNE